MLKILQARLQQYMNHELPDFKLVLEKVEEPEIKLPTSIGSSKKQESSRKISTSSLLTMSKPLTVWVTTSCGKFLKMMQLKCCTQYVSKFGKLSSGHRNGKGQLSFQSQRKAMPKNVQTTAHLYSSHTVAK